MTDNPTPIDLQPAREALLLSLRDQISDSRVLDAFAGVPRERFVSDDQRSRAYDDRPLPIGYGQTISQPRMVALVLQEARLHGDERVLEVGAGSGYQTALLARLARQVVAVELLSELLARATGALTELAYGNIELHQAGEALGWPAGAPYDVIIVAAAAPRVPQSLVDQLTPDGRLLIPVGPRDEQSLMLVENGPRGVSVTRKEACRFVPLVGITA